LSSEEKTPYFSKRVRIADIKSPKECVGMKERTIEVTLGNSDEPVISSNPSDVADVKSQDMKSMILELFAITDEIAKERGFEFLDKRSSSNE